MGKDIKCENIRVTPRTHTTLGCKQGRICLMCLICLFVLILNVQSTIFQLNGDGSSWDETSTKLGVRLLTGMERNGPP